MIAQNNPHLTQAAETLFKMNSDDMVRQHCLARRDYERDQALQRQMMEQLRADLEKSQAELGKRDVELHKRDAELHKRDAELHKRDAELAALQAKYDALLAQQGTERR